MNRHAKGSFNYLEHFTYYIPGAAGILSLLLWLLVGALLGNLVNIASLKLLGSEAGMEYGTLISYPLMFIPAMMFASSASRRRCLDCGGLKLDSSNFKPMGGPGAAILAMTGTVCLGYCADLTSSLLPPMPEWLEESLKMMTQGTLWINFLCVSIFAPIFEEWLCRGMVLRGLLGRGRISPAWAIVISAAFFAFIHLNPWQAIPAFLLGCLFGYVYWRTGSLKLTMLMHFTNNTLALVLSNTERFKDMETWSDVFTGPVYWIIFTACLLATALVLLRFSRTEMKGAGNNCDAVGPLFN